MIHPIDPALPDLIADMNSIVRVVKPLDPPRLRDDFRNMIGYLRADGEVPQVGSVVDEVVECGGAAVGVRIYRASDDGRTGDVVVFFHGGGWMVGDLETGDITARALANGMDATVVAVDYRLAPEHPFPAAFNDCLAVTRAVAAAHSPRWLAVAGDSAGGNLAAAVANAESSVLGGVVDAQLLWYPALDPNQDLPSYRRFGIGYSLTAEAMRLYWTSYTGNRWASDQRAAPAIAQGLSGAPPSVICTAGYDVLHDEGERYAAMLVEAGVRTAYLPFPRLTHGWLDLTDRLPAAAAAREAAVAVLASLRDATVGGVDRSA